MPDENTNLPQPSQEPAQAAQPVPSDRPSLPPPRKPRRSAGPT